MLSKNSLDRMVQYQSFQRMIRNRAPNTVARYARDLVDVFEKTGLDPDQIISFAKSHDEVELGDLQAKILDGRSHGMRFIINNDIRRLLKSNGVKDLPEEKTRYIPQQDHEAYSKQEIQNLLEWINFPRGKLLVYISAESGLRIHNVLSLQYMHVKDDFEKGRVPIFIKFSPQERQNAKGTGYPFIGEGSYRLLKECVENNIVKTDPESYLFPAGKNAKKSPHLTYASVHDIIELAREKAKTNPSIQPNHGLRKYCEHSLIKAEIPELIIKRFMGHSLGSGEAYVTKDVNELREYYRKAYPYISLDSSVSSEAWQEQKTAIEARIAKLEKRLDEVLQIMEKKAME